MDENALGTVGLVFGILGIISGYYLLLFMAGYLAFAGMAIVAVFGLVALGVGKKINKSVPLVLGIVSLVFVFLKLIFIFVR